MTNHSRIARRLRIHGHVQGVWYRQWTIETARRLGVDGWVRNRGDGTVEAVVAGTDVAVEALIAACHAGPPAARVERIDVETLHEAIAAGFRSLPTA